MELGAAEEAEHAGASSEVIVVFDEGDLFVPQPSVTAAKRITRLE
jgi:hypothetical protein